MPSLRVHKRISKDRTNFNFEQLHQWIDKYSKELGINHRTKRHSYNESEEATIRKYWDEQKGKGWGDKAVCEWLFHIAIDNLETAFKMGDKAYNKNHVYNYFTFGLSPNSKFIFYDFKSANQAELENQFKNYYEIEE